MESNNMRNKIFIIFLFLLWTGLTSSYSQINISFDSDCLDKNGAIVSQALIETAGIDVVTMLLENKTRIAFACNVDSLGHILKIRKILTKKDLPNNLMNDLESFLISNNISFFICTHPLPGKSQCEAYKLVAGSFHKQEEHIIGSVSFPVGEWFYLQYDRYLEENPENPLSIFEYLQQQIDKYLPKELPLGILQIPVPPNCAKVRPPANFAPALIAPLCWA
jgi:hypothetical protein